MDISVCDDCAFVSANGFHGAEFPESFVRDYVARATELGAEPVLNCDDDECYSFSWKSCDFCGSTLGGNRHPAVLLYK